MSRSTAVVPGTKMSTVGEQAGLHFSECDVSINAEATTLYNTNKDCNPTSHDNSHVLPVAYSICPGQEESKDLSIGMDIQESTIIANSAHSLLSRPQTCAENQAHLIDSFQTKAVINILPQENETSACVAISAASEDLGIRNSDVGIASNVGNIQETQKTELTSILDNDLQHAQTINISCPSDVISTSQIAKAEFKISELNPAQIQHQAQETFIGPIIPSKLQHESMDVETSDSQSTGYDFSNKSVPVFVTWASTEYLRTSAENFLRGCKWSPDGSQLLTNSNDNILRVFNMSDAVLGNDNSSDIEQISKVLMRESSTVYDYAWIPSMDIHHLDSCRIATTCSGIPIHLWDSTKGKIIASYKAFDQYDEVTAAYSLSFSISGSQVFGGYKKAIRVFDTEYPGRKCKLIKTCGTKKSRSQPGQTGIISCFAHNPTFEDSFAAGSYTRHIGLYDLRCEGATCVVEGQRGGITHLVFTPDGNMLLSGARKDNEILCWDMRNLGTVCFSALRDVSTNQRMYFDLTRSGRYMTSGNDDGTVTFWDLQRQADLINGRPYLKPEAQFQAHSDSVNGVSFHPSGDFLATAAGQRHFQDFGKMDSSDSDDEDDDDMGKEGAITKDFSMRIWRMPYATEYAE